MKKGIVLIITLVALMVVTDIHAQTKPKLTWKISRVEGADNATSGWKLVFSFANLPAKPTDNYMHMMIWREKDIFHPVNPTPNMYVTPKAAWAAMEQMWFGVGDTPAELGIPTDDEDDKDCKIEFEWSGRNPYTVFLPDRLFDNMPVPDNPEDIAELTVYYYIGFEIQMSNGCSFSSEDNPVPTIPTIMYVYDGEIGDDDIQAETEVLESLFPEGEKNPWVEKVDEARELMYCPDPRYDKAITLLEEAAEHGNTNAMWMLAQIYMEGTHTDRSIAKAWEYAVKASDAGNPIGTYWLSVLYGKGEGASSKNRAENEKMSSDLYNEARQRLADEISGKQTEGLKRDYTELRKADVWETLGRMVEQMDMKQLDPHAEKFFKKAADEGSSYALRRMGDYCMTSSFTSLDNFYDKKADSKNIPNIPSYAQAMTYYNKAAVKGDAEAQNMLGVLIIQKSIALQSQNTPTSDNYYLKDAFKNFSSSASQGNSDAAYNLGYCYENGYGCTKDIEKAKSFYRGAAQKGSKKAKEKLNTLSK